MERSVIDYFKVQEAADKYRLDYNALSAAVRHVAVASPAAPARSALQELVDCNDADKEIRRLRESGDLAKALRLNAKTKDRWLNAWFSARTALDASPAAPIDMILHCPKCHTQHIDCSEADAGGAEGAWDNPPHRSHLCHGCGFIWRPADVPTNGVAEIKTKGKNDAST